MKKWLFILGLIASIADADTPAPGVVKLRGATDNTEIGNVSDSLKVTGTTSISGNVPVTQVTSPWVTSVTNFPSTFGVTQSTSPWVTSRNWTLGFAGDSVTSYEGGAWTVGVSNFPATFGVTQSTSPWIVGFSSTPTVNVGNFPASQVVSQLTGSLLHVDVDNFPATQVVSGTVTANAGTGNFTVVQSTGSNLHVNVDSAPTTSVTQGTSPWVVSGSTTVSGTVTALQGTTPWIVDGSGVVQPVSGTFFQAVQPVSQSGSWTVLQGSPPWSVSQSGTWNLNNISGTITLPTGASTASNQSTVIANQTNGTQKTQVVDGSGNVWGPVTTLSGTNYQPVVLAASGASGSTAPVRTIQVGGLGPDGNLHTLSTDNSGVPSTGRAVLSTFTQSYSSANLSISAFTTIISSTSVPLNEEDIFDNSGGLWYLAYAATCGALSTSTNAIIVGPGGGGKTFAIPSGNCVGFQAIGTAITAGNVYMTFYK